jgi:hypothetical protein
MDYIKMGLKMAVICYLQSKLQMFNYLSEMIKRTLLNKSQQETTLKFYKVPALLSLVYDMCSTQTKQQLEQMETPEKCFLRSVAGYRTDRNRN